MIPAISSKLYHDLVAHMIQLNFNDPERARLGAIQRQLADAQVAMLKDKTLDEWRKAG